MSQLQPAAPKTQPLLGKRIVVTRAREQSSRLVARLSELGATPLPFPVIKIVPPESWNEMDRAVDELSGYDWVVFTSVNGVEYFWQRLLAAGKDASAFKGVKVCAIGPATAATLEANGVKPALVPARFVAEGILEELERGGDLKGLRFLLPRADLAREALVEGLEARGAEVRQITAYRTVVGGDDSPGATTPEELVALLERGEIDMVTFTSSSTVRNFAARLAAASSKPFPELLKNSAVGCIGPITAGTAREMGLRVDLEAAEFTIDKLVEAIIEFFDRR